MQNTDMKIYVWVSTRQKNSMLCKQGDNMFHQYIVCSASKVSTFSLVNRTCQVVVNRMLRQQGDNALIIYQSCHAIAKQDDSHYMINLAPVLFENVTVTFMDIRPIADIAFPASVTKNCHVEKDEMTVTFSSTILVDIFSFVRP
jgi:hypothetical protein